MLFDSNNKIIVIIIKFVLRPSCFVCLWFIHLQCLPWLSLQNSDAIIVWGLLLALAESFNNFDEDSKSFNISHAWPNKENLAELSSQQKQQLLRTLPNSSIIYAFFQSQDGLFNHPDTIALFRSDFLEYCFFNEFMWEFLII